MASLPAILFRLSFLSVPVILVYIFLRSRQVFYVKIKNGKVTAWKGRVSKAFVDGCADIASQYKIKSGTVSASLKSGRVSLSFSRNIPKIHHQRFRNIWHNCR